MALLFSWRNKDRSLWRSCTYGKGKPALVGKRHGRVPRLFGLCAKDLCNHRKRLFWERLRYHERNLEVSWCDQSAERLWLFLFDAWCHSKTCQQSAAARHAELFYQVCRLISLWRSSRLEHDDIYAACPRCLVRARRDASFSRRHRSLSKRDRCDLPHGTQSGKIDRWTGTDSCRSFGWWHVDRSRLFCFQHGSDPGLWRAVRRSADLYSKTGRKIWTSKFWFCLALRGQNLLSAIGPSQLFLFKCLKRKLWSKFPSASAARRPNDLFGQCQQNRSFANSGRAWEHQNLASYPLFAG